MTSRRTLAALAAGALMGVTLALSPASKAQDKPDNALRPASDFQSIGDATERSVALFQEAGKVIQHPRCVNCHPRTDRPLQNLAMTPHQPPVTRGDGGMGMPGMTCNTCHGAENIAVVGQSESLKSIPGHPSWHLAPIEMAWEGKSLGEICLQLKDPERNGNKTMAEMVEYMAEDTLVGWGWNPGEGRQPVPGSQEVFGQLIAAWVETGAACPTP
jgi:hypothetical protein